MTPPKLIILLKVARFVLADDLLPEMVGGRRKAEKCKMIGSCLPESGNWFETSAIVSILLLK